MGHADLAAEHFLIDPGAWTVTGVIDWGDMAVSDRALDFAGISHWGGGQFVKNVIARTALRRDTWPRFLRKAEFMRTRASIRWRPALLPHHGGVH